MSDLQKELEAFNNSLRENYGTEIESIDLKESEEELQRSEQWMKDRLGMFSGSGMKNLMACSIRPSAKNPKDWGQKRWLCALGESALNYIIERAIERATGQNIEKYMSWHAKWGINHEQEGKDYVEDNRGLHIYETGFLKFLKNAGASPDGYLIPIEDANKKIGFEIQCPATVISHMELMNSPICEGHPYFWQTQAEMMALSADTLDFYTYDKRFPESVKLGRQNVNLSAVHAFAIEFRCILGEKLINAILEKNFKCSPRAELLSICEDVPEDFEELQNWFKNERTAIAI